MTNDATNLRDTTSYLLRAPDVGTWLKLADNYMQTYNRMPASFVLPADHAIVRPIVEAFASDTGAFADYIKALRDASDGVAYDELHALYRTISIRALQTTRRTRVRKAVLLLTPAIEELTSKTLSYDDQVVLAKYVEQAWGTLRLTLMDRERAALSRKRLDTEDRAVLLDAFWKDIDNKIEKGQVLLGETSLDDLVELMGKR